VLNIEWIENFNFVNVLYNLRSMHTISQVSVFAMDFFDYLSREGLFLNECPKDDVHNADFIRQKFQFFSSFLSSVRCAPIALII
jgi:hypothetical protein